MNTKVNQQNAMEYMREVASSRLTVAQRSLANIVLNNSWFAQAPGSSKMHHAYPGGLAHHTAEVVENCIYMMGESANVDSEALILAAIWHDYMKTEEYAVVNEAIIKTPYYYKTGHIVGGAMAFREASLCYSVHDKRGYEFVEAVTHMILSHHGRAEWRSPVEPQTPEAWILHAADMLSARPMGGRR